MRYKHFKNADADISALTVGTWGIAGANSAGVTWGDVDTEESIAAIRQMNENMNIPSTFDMIKEEDIPLLVQRALKEGNPLYPVPKIMDAKDCEAVIRSFMA